MPRVIHFEVPYDDADRVRRFYEVVFGWSFQPFPGVPGYFEVATGRDGPGIDGGFGKRDPRMPHVTNSIGVDSVDASVEKVLANGGKLIFPKMPVPNMGWLAYGEDTEGNPFGLFQGDPAAGTSGDQAGSPDPGSRRQDRAGDEMATPRVIHFDIPCDDLERAKGFYGTVFGWTFQQWGDVPYWLATTGKDEPGIDGGFGQRTVPGDTTMNSIGVPDVDAYAQKVVANGGKAAGPRTPLPGIGWLVWCQDTEGNPFGLFQDDPSAK